MVNSPLANTRTNIFYTYKYFSQSLETIDSVNYGRGTATLLSNDVYVIVISVAVRSDITRRGGRTELHGFFGRIVANLQAV